MADAHPNISDLIIDCADPERLKGYETGGFLVMADPEGNEFCIIPKDPFELDDAGAHQLPEQPRSPTQAAMRTALANESREPPLIAGRRIAADSTGM
jgi:hypothetical protein